MLVEAHNSCGVDLAVELVDGEAFVLDDEGQSLQWNLTNVTNVEAVSGWEVCVRHPAIYRQPENKENFPKLTTVGISLFEINCWESKDSVMYLKHFPILRSLLGTPLIV